MRENLYRAKQTPDSDWVEGSLIIGNNYNFIITDEDYQDVVASQSTLVCESHPIEKDNKTLGQYIWRKDKNGKKIFEGDILKSLLYPFQNDKGEVNYYAEIVWLEDECSFGFIIHKNPKSSVIGISEGDIERIAYFESENWEVIGNIYDNPELIK